jgi:hypothetical protein
LEYWALEAQLARTDTDESFNDMIDINDVNDLGGIGDANNIDDVNDAGLDEIGFADFNDFSSLTIRGPYGPPWPLVTEPVEFEVGSAKVRIEIEDENAKYPLGWTVLSDKDKQVKREAEIGFEIFSELMELDAGQDSPLITQLENCKNADTTTDTNQQERYQPEQE